MSQKLQVTIIGGRDLAAKDIGGTSDPYVKLKWQGKEYRTERVNKSLNPTWNQSFLLDWEPSIQNPPLTFEVFDWDRFTRDDSMGSVSLRLPPNTQMNAAPMEGWYNLQNGKGQIGIKFQLQPGSGQQANRPYQGGQQPVGGYPSYPSYPPQTGQQQQQHQHQYQQQQHQPVGGYPSYPSYQPQPGQQPNLHIPIYSQHTQTQPRPPPSYKHTDSPAAGSVSDAAVQAILTIMPHLSRQQVEKALVRHNGDKQAATAELMGHGQPPKKKVEPNVQYIQDIRNILPNCTYEEIATALIKWNNDKERALEELIQIAITIAAENSPLNKPSKPYSWENSASAFSHNKPQQPYTWGDSTSAYAQQHEPSETTVTHPYLS